MVGTTTIENPAFGGLFGKTRQSVLAILYGRPDKSFYTRQVMDAVGTGRGTVQRELKNLTDAGIISREVQGRQVYYRANAACPIFDDLKGIVRKTFGVVEFMRRSLGPAAGGIVAAFIFDSVARSAGDRLSDLNIMVIGEVGRKDVITLLSAAEEQLGRGVNAVVYPVAEFQQKMEEDDFFIKSVLQGQKRFIIGDEDELTELAES